MKKINHFKKRNLVGYSLFFLVTIISAFAITKFSNPYSSEMYFAEKANNPSIVGSVIPASCSSDPKINNNDGNCGGCSCNANTEEWSQATSYWCQNVGGWTFTNSCGTNLSQTVLRCLPKGQAPPSQVVSACGIAPATPKVQIWFN